MAMCESPLCLPRVTRPDRDSGTTKMLYQAVFRYMCKIADRPEERIFIQETSDPISSEIALNDTSPAFTQKYLESFREPLPEDQSKAVLQDRLSTGWLAWGKTIEVCRMTGWEEYDFYVDEECKPGIEQIRPIIESQEFWQTVSPRRAGKCSFGLIP